MPTRELQAYLKVPTSLPSMTRVGVRDVTDLLADLDLGVARAQVVQLDGYSPTDDDDRALLREVFAWLKSVPGDFVLVDDGWMPVLERVGDQYVTDNPYVAALL